MMGITPMKYGLVKSNGSLPVSPRGWDFGLFDRFLDDVWGYGHSRATGIRLDVHEAEDRILVYAEVPGIDPSDLEINLTGELLTLSGEKKDQAESIGGNRSHAERIYGSFERMVQLPCPVDPDAIEAVHRNGVVTITLQKAEAVRPKRIAIKSA